MLLFLEVLGGLSEEDLLGERKGDAILRIPAAVCMQFIQHKTRLQLATTICRDQKWGRSDGFYLTGARTTLQPTRCTKNGLLPVCKAKSFRLN